MPVCIKENSNIKCKTSNKTLVKSCIYDKNIYTTKNDYCVKIYGSNIETHSIKIFQKDTSDIDYIDVTNNLKNITINDSEDKPSFLIYDCNNNGCVQTSGIVKYKTGPNTKDEFVSCSMNNIKKLEYAINDECSGTSHSNQNKIQYSANIDKNNHQTSNLKICTDVSEQTSSLQSLKFINMYSDSKLDKYFSMIIGNSSPFPDTITKQKVVFKITNDAYALASKL